MSIGCLIRIRLGKEREKDYLVQMKTIFYLEYRGGSSSIYHFLVLNLGGLFYILNEMYDVTAPDNNKLNDNRLVKAPTNKISFPITIYMDIGNNSLSKVIKDAFNVIKDRFVLIQKIPEGSDYEIVNIYGEPCYINSACNNPGEIFPFVRNLFLDKIPVLPGNKLFFIGRKQSFQNNFSCNTNPIRSIINENDFVEQLKKLNIECIYLEEYNFEEKIKLFNSAELIISTNSSALTFLMFCDKKVKVIEMLNKLVSGPGIHFKLICDTLGLKYYRYSAINDDDNGNFSIEDNDPIYDFIKKII